VLGAVNGFGTMNGHTVGETDAVRRGGKAAAGS